MWTVVSGWKRFGVTYICAAAGLGDASGVAAEDDVGAERAAGAVVDVGLGALEGAVRVLSDLGADDGRGSGENECRLHLEREVNW